MSGSLYICIKQFNARLGDELSLKIGDKIEVLADDSEYNDGWYMGKNLLTTEVGLYPKSFTQILKHQDSPALRSRSRISSNNSSSNLSTLSQVNPLNTNEYANNSSSSTNITTSSGPVGVNTVNGNHNSSNKSINAGGSNNSHPLSNINAQSNTNDLTSSVKGLSISSDKKSGVASAATATKTLGSNAENGSSSERNSLLKNSNSLRDNTSSTINDIDNVLQEIRDNPYAKKSNYAQEVPSPTNEYVSEKMQPSSSASAINSTANATNNYHDGATSRSGSLRKTNSSPIVPTQKTEAPPVPAKTATGNSLSPQNARSWSPEEVTAYFAKSLRFDQAVAEKFTTHHITGEILFELDLAHLKELEIDKFGTRFQIYKEIENLKNLAQKNDYQAPPQSPDIANNSETFNNRNSRANDDLPSVPGRFPSPQKQSSLMPSASIHRKGHERKRSNSLSDLNPQYQFGDVPQEPRPAAVQHTRTSSSVYEASVYSGNHQRGMSGSKTPNHHRRQSSTTAALGPNGHHRRHSSLFSFLSGNEEQKKDAQNQVRNSSLSSPTKDGKGKRQSVIFSPQQIKAAMLDSPEAQAIPDIDRDTQSPKNIFMKGDDKDSDSLSDDKPLGTDPPSVSRLKTLRTASTQNFKNLTTSRKSKTSAFQEGIQEVSPDEAIKTASYSGWMSKRSGNTLSWRSRYFTLHGTRLSYFTSLKDKREKGLIDITAHKVIPAEQDSSSNNDKYIALYASTTGSGRYVFKLVPPAPGFKKGLTFTQPKTHYFAVDTKEEMRGWMKALMTATIDIDDSVPVVSSCSTPTVSLSKAQEMLAQAREETRLKDEELRSKGYLRDGYEDNSHVGHTGEYGHFMSDSDRQDSPILNSSHMLDSDDDTTNSSQTYNSRPKLTIDSNAGKNNGKGPTTPSLSQGGFASPYLLASGLLSPKSGGTGSPMDTPPGNRDYFHENNSERVASYSSNVGSSPLNDTPKTSFSNSTGRVISGGRKASVDRMVSYSSDTSGNTTFQSRKK